MGYHDLKKMYYENRQKELDKLLGFEQLKVENAELLDKQRRLEEKEEILQKRKAHYDNICLETLHLNLPLNNHVPVDSAFINILPSCTNDLVRFAEHLSKHTQQFISRYSEYKTRELEFVEGYFLGVCTYVATYLFNPENCRVHVRCLDENNNYSKLTASLGNEVFDKPLTPITSERGMIFEAGKAKKSLIKSLNMDYHIPGKNDHIWEEYMTIVFDEINYNGKPQISMGISVNNHERYKYQLFFLNYCRVEQVIQNNVMEFNSKCNLVDVLKRERKAG